LSPGFKAQTTSPGAEIPLKKVFFSKNSPFPLAPSSIAAKQRTEMAGVYFRGKKSLFHPVRPSARQVKCNHE
jgi:hypothetical protein